MLSIQGTYDGKKLKLFQQVKIRSSKKVIITFLDDIDDEISSEELHYLMEKGGAFEFLNNTDEDIYTCLLYTSPSPRD